MVHSNSPTSLILRLLLVVEFFGQYVLAKLWRRSKIPGPIDPKYRSPYTKDRDRRLGAVLEDETFSRFLSPESWVSQQETYEPRPQGLDPISKLLVNITQPGTQQKINVKLSNLNNFTVTIAPYYTPLEDRAFDYGLFQTSNETVLDLTRGKNGRHRFVHVRKNITPQRLRQNYTSPPDPESLIELGTGQIRENSLNITAKHVDNSYTILMRGPWVGVWPKKREEVAKELEEGKAWIGEEWEGYWASDTILLRV